MELDRSAGRSVSGLSECSSASASPEPTPQKVPSLRYRIPTAAPRMAALGRHQYLTLNVPSCCQFHRHQTSMLPTHSTLFREHRCEKNLERIASSRGLHPSVSSYTCLHETLLVVEVGPSHEHCARLTHLGPWPGIGGMATPLISWMKDLCRSQRQRAKHQFRIDCWKVRKWQKAYRQMSRADSGSSDAAQAASISQ